MRAKQGSATRKLFLCSLRVAAVGQLLIAASTSASRTSRWSSIRYRSRSRRCGTASLVPLPRIGPLSMASTASCNGPAGVVRSITDQYRAAWQRLGRDPEDLPLLGMSRHIVVADSDAEAYEEARAAYDQWFANLNLLWTQRGVPIPLNFPSDFDDAVNAGFCVVGSPSTVRDRLLPQVEEAGINYLLGRLAFGNLPVERSLRSVELLEAEVLPALAGGGASRSG